MWGGKHPLRWLEIFGFMSYSIYLLHRPLCFIFIEQTGIARWVDSYPSFYGACAAVILPLLAVCAWTCVNIETRFRRMKRRATDTVHP